MWNGQALVLAKLSLVLRSQAAACVFLAGHPWAVQAGKLSLVADLRHAYGVGEYKVRNIVKQYMESGLSGKRKQRCDTGETVFNSQRKRESELTPLFYYKKLQRKRHQDTILTDSQLAAGFEALSADVQQQCAAGAQQLMGIMANIDGEIKRVMRQSNGNVSWTRLAILISGGTDQVQPVSCETLRKEVMSRDDFR